MFLPGFVVLIAGWCSFLSAGADIQEEDGVLVLTEKNFEGAIKSNPYILVEFYAPWCGHCKQFAPEYAAAAGKLKQAEPPIPLAKVDATVEGKLSEDYGVRGYPTIRLFVDGKDQEYTGGRTEQSIVAWVLKKAGPPAVQLADVAAATAFEASSSFVVLGLFDEATSRAPFEDAARRSEDVMFAYSAEPAVAAKYGLKPPAVRMLFPHDDKAADFAGDLQSADEIATFVKSYRHPLVTIFNGETAPDLFEDGRPILFLFRDDDEKGRAAEAELRKTAASLGRRMLVSVAGSSEPMDQRLMDYVSVEPEELPTVRLVVNAAAAMTKYRLEGAMSEASMVAFVKDYEAGKLRPHFKSEPVPASQSGPVRVLVGSTFESVVKDPAKDVLVEFYAPWCGHCKKLDPIYRAVANRLDALDTLVIAKIDATANDVEGVDVEGFPTIKFWPADQKDEPLDYDGDRDEESIVAWLTEKATHPVGGARTEL